MPRSPRVPKEEALQIEFEFKKHINAAGSNVTDTVRRLNEEYGTTETPQAVTQQLKNGTMPVWKQNRIAKVLGFKIKWEREEER
ncbi:hypothetical protein EV210_101183 [Anaerospora hongkongensis]|uniref:Uncharacterized protein n=2 Tax=Anaerospora hongkongensis TaxID=244830 RepID=A0A4V2Q928_9FIRM|nr:hypothetical protein EV210_101183 [Anaerospora hongkongensis]